MSDPSSDQSIENEPHFRGGKFRPDPAEAQAEETLARACPSEEQRLEQSVWDEPAFSGDLAGQPQEGELTYDIWLLQGRECVGMAQSWAITIAVAMLAGGWGVLGALMSGFMEARGQLTMSLDLVVFAPVVEEVMKTALALTVIERRPFWFRSRFQIGLCALAGGLAFACIENVLYLQVYIPDPSPTIVHWRWTVCVALHMGCSLIAGMGLMRMWGDVWSRRARTRLALGFPYLVAAIILHGSYNLLALLFERTVFRS